MVLEEWRLQTASAPLYYLSLSPELCFKQLSRSVQRKLISAWILHEGPDCGTSRDIVPYIAWPIFIEIKNVTSFSLSIITRMQQRATIGVLTGNYLASRLQYLAQALAVCLAARLINNP